MNRATCGLQNSDSPPSDNLTPQETTTQDSPDLGRDGAGLPCPGSSVVAESGQDNYELNPLIKSLADNTQLNTHQKEFRTNEEDLG
jgi:hypothetical protein